MVEESKDASQVPFGCLKRKEVGLIERTWSGMVTMPSRAFEIKLLHILHNAPQFHNPNFKL
jgi:hypothetical protein